MSIRVLFQGRRNAFSVVGGDTIQMIQTREALLQLGCKVDIEAGIKADVSRYDIVHLFNLMRPQETYLQGVNAKSWGRKFVLSTIYGSYREYDVLARGGLSGRVARLMTAGAFETFKVIGRVVRNREISRGTLVLLRRGYRKLQEELLAMTDVLLPNSEPEMRRIIDEFSMAKGKPYVAVPNGIDAKVFDRNATRLAEKARRHEGCVLCVARVEGRKNQLNLVRAINGLPFQLVLIGKPAPNHGSYFRRVRREAGNNVHFLGGVEHGSLPSYYKAARVHALVSWMETPGLASLEAAAMGCNLVVSDRGDTRDYFGDEVFYCQPDSVMSIREAIIAAYEAPINWRLRENVLQKFTWEKAAERSLVGYKIALGW